MMWARASVVLVVFGFLAVGSGLLRAQSGGEPPPTIDFAREIRPILAEHCFPCHGFDAATREADLRLDTIAAVQESESGIWPFVPGDLDKSEAWQRIISDDPDLQMPPPRAHLALTVESREKLRRWILGGANYAQHWAFAPPIRPADPAIGPNDSYPVAKAIDYWIGQAHQREALTAAPRAPREILARRVAFDLTGLPPEPDLLQLFLADTSSDAYERFVDALIDSPHFGEHQASFWLDAARYADTNGYSIDGGRHAWLWRDWVIQAINDNLPYDQFLLQQLAGDLLPNATDSQRVATGMQRNNMVTHEGGTIPEENLANYSADRMKTFGEAVLGLTLGCAQCHDHKYDPISQREYYQLAAFFNRLPERGLDGDAGVNAHPSIQAKTCIQATDLENVRQELQEISRWFGQPQPDSLKAWQAEVQKSQVQRGVDLVYLPLKVHAVSTPNQGSGFGVNDRGWAEIRDAGGLSAFDLAAALPESSQPIQGLKVIFHPRADAPLAWGHGVIPGGADKHTFVLTSLDVSTDAVGGDQLNLHRLETFSRITASSWLPQFPPRDIRDHRNYNGWSPDPQQNGPQSISVTFTRPLDPATQRFVTVQVNFGYGHRLIGGLIEIQAFSGNDSGTDLPQEIESLLLQEAASWGESDQNQLWKYYTENHDQARPYRIRRENLQERIRVLTEPFSALVMQDSDKPRSTHILARGDYSQPGEPVSAATPAVLPALEQKKDYNRLDLAHWLIRPDHPLTSRVAVNRAWLSLFGRGIVATPADFGSQGTFPSHPELLDWLAVELRETGWDWKRLIKQMVLSETYCQSSDITDSAWQRDPENIWLARGPRFRLSAEQIRDQALAVSGLLVPRIGGPSVNPYAPGDLWREISHFGSTPATAQTFVQDHGEKLYRRSLYTYWKRTSPPVNMAVFDAPNREVCVIQRQTTTTPLQSLVLLNDVQFVEAARVFGVRVRRSAEDDEQRLRQAFTWALARAPRDGEIEILVRALGKQREYFAATPGAAEELLSLGEWPAAEDIDTPEQAAWAQIALMLFNLSEMVTRQ